MKKVFHLCIPLLLVSILSACSGEETTPEERLEEYVNHWNNQEFEEMYDMLSTEAAEAYPTEQFVDRYQKLYGDLDVENLNVNFEVPEEGEEAEPKEDGTVSYPITVEMDTMGGPISFDYDATMVQQESDEETNWFVDWDPGYIFPELKDGGEVRPVFDSPQRGQIFDRNHNGLAVNEVIYEIGVIPGEFGENEEETKEKLADLLAMEVDTIDQMLSADWVEPDLFVPLKKVPTTNEEKLEKLFELDPVRKQDTTGRMYPYGEATSHLVGYIGDVTAEELENMEDGNYSSGDQIGKRGLELLYEDRLRGKAGTKIVVTYPEQDKEDVVLTETPVENGEDIIVTIDAELQKTIYDSYGDDTGSAAAIHPKTGETLALVSSPGFDPNEMAYGISSTRREELQSNPKQPLQNRYSATYAPGSTIKPITAAIGLEADAFDPNEGITIEGETWQKDSSWGNYRVKRVSESTGPVDLTDALVRSDNIYFAQKGLEMGKDTLVNGLQQFGFGEEFPFAYPIEQSTISNSGEIDSEAQLADTSFGQGQMEMSSIHLAVAYTPFFNEGDIIKPILEEEEEKSQVWKEDVISTDNIQSIKDAFRKVVTAPTGTAPEADIEAVDLAGKTGTAELKQSLDDEDAEENGWFVVYPDDEELLLSMMVENVKEEGGSHYVVEKAANIFKEIR
ncbi:penicillin-binding transpeptidase domain-containing protein [Sediminibacillus massiliensis]|uniref:penicillin-binding transpeptidase domain-containing protein n=1 Tax=Sediminibacillus massiliensis TaxID=1926277 RepID=UPI00098860EC|nr:penicillin-binding transpeptidase domain-containing protein [Sediminibacillus massiliensis]